MPDYCMNYMLISENDLDKVYNKEDEEVDFNIVKPMPNSLDITCGSIQNKVLAMYEYKTTGNSEQLNSMLDAPIFTHYFDRAIEMAESKGISVYSDNDILRLTDSDTTRYAKFKDIYTADEYCEHIIEKDYAMDKAQAAEALGLNGDNAPPIEKTAFYTDFRFDTAMDKAKTYIENREKYGVDTWFDWTNKEWGTKWNAVETEITPLEDNIVQVNFETAWNAPYKWLEALAEQNIPFSLEWVTEEGGHGYIKSDGKGEVEEAVLDDIEFGIDEVELDVIEFEEVLSERYSNEKPKTRNEKPKTRNEVERD